MSNTEKMIAGLGYEQEPVGFYITAENGVVIVSSDTPPSEEQFQDIKDRLSIPVIQVVEGPIIPGDELENLDEILSWADPVATAEVSAERVANLVKAVRTLQARQLLRAPAVPDKPHLVSDEVVEFEAWVPTYLGKKFLAKIDLARDEDGQYRYDPVSSLSKAWHARAEKSRAHIALLQRELSNCELNRNENYATAYALRQERDELRQGRDALIGPIAAWSVEARAAVLESFQAELNESASYPWYDAAISDLMRLVESVPVNTGAGGKCDGDHGGGQCQDPECWNGGEPKALPKDWLSLAHKLQEVGLAYWVAHNRERGPGAVKILRNDESGAAFVVTRGEYAERLSNFVMGLDLPPDPIIKVLKNCLAEGVQPTFSGGDLKHLINLLEKGS